MKLFYSPGACSLVSHILLVETKLPFELVKVDTKAHKTEAGVDYYTLNPKGSVPLLQLDDGQFLSEGPVIDKRIRANLDITLGNLPDAAWTIAGHSNNVGQRHSGCQIEENLHAAMFI